MSIRWEATVPIDARREALPPNPVSISPGNFRHQAAEPDRSMVQSAGQRSRTRANG